MVERGGRRRGLRLLAVGLGLIVIGGLVLAALLLIGPKAGSPGPPITATPTGSSSPSETPQPPPSPPPPQPAPAQTVAPVDLAGMAALLTSLAGVITAVTGLVIVLRQPRPGSADAASKK